MKTAGIDIGSATGKAVVLEDDRIVAWGLIETGPDSAETAKEAMDMALQKANLSFSALEYVVSTGYGRVIVPFAQRNITEVSCHAKGAHWFFPGARTILDMGGQDFKCIRCDSTGKVVNFAMSDKCAAGAGRSMEVMAELLEVPLAEMGGLSLAKSNGDLAVSSTCVLFARSEVLAHLREGVPVSDILGGLCAALATRVFGLLRRVGVEPEFVISGGIAKNVGVVRRLEQRVGAKARICFEPQIVGALGAALFARELMERQKTRLGASS